MSLVPITVGDVVFTVDTATPHSADIIASLQAFALTPQMNFPLTGLVFLRPDGTQSQPGDKLTVNIVVDGTGPSVRLSNCKSCRTSTPRN